jgi:hypothetical protein
MLTPGNGNSQGFTANIFPHSNFLIIADAANRASVASATGPIVAPGAAPASRHQPCGHRHRRQQAQRMNLNDVLASRTAANVKSNFTINFPILPAKYNRCSCAMVALWLFWL